MSHRVLALLLCCVLCFISYSQCMPYDYELDEAAQIDEFMPFEQFDHEAMHADTTITPPAVHTHPKSYNVAAALERLLSTPAGHKAKEQQTYGDDPLTLPEWKPSAKQLLIEFQQEQLMEKLKMEHLHRLSLLEQIERILPVRNTQASCQELYDLIVQLPKILKPEVISKPTFTQDMLHVLRELQEDGLVTELQRFIDTTKQSESSTTNCLTTDITSISHIYEPFTAYFANTRSGSRVIGFGDSCSNTRIFNEYYHNSNCDRISIPVPETEALEWQYRDMHAAFQQCFADQLTNKNLNNNQYSALASLASSVGCHHNKFDNLIQTINDGNVLSTVCQIQLLQVVPKRGATEAKLFMSPEQPQCASQKPANIILPTPKDSMQPTNAPTIAIPNTGSHKEVVPPGVSNNKNNNVPVLPSRPVTPPTAHAIPTHNTRREEPNGLSTFQQSSVVTDEASGQTGKNAQLGLSLTGLLALLIGAGIFVALTAFACIKLRRYRKLLDAKRTNESLQRLSTADQTTAASYGYVL